MDTFTRIRTVLTAVAFWLGLAGSVIAIVLNELGPYIDHPTVSIIVTWLLPVASVVTVLALIIRRVQEVIPADRGLLPNPYASSLEAARRHRDLGAAPNDVVWTIVGVLAILALLIWIVPQLG